ncbi:MAG: hypothetical protein ACRD4K_02325 [Candidatus Acidiferrales bacterium]
MPTSQNALIFYALFSLGRALFWLVRAGGSGRSMQVLLLSLLVVFLSCANYGNGQTLLAPAEAALTLPAILAAITGMMLSP